MDKTRVPGSDPSTVHIVDVIELQVGCYWGSFLGVTETEDADMDCPEHR